MPPRVAPPPWRPPTQRSTVGCLTACLYFCLLPPAAWWHTLSVDISSAAAQPRCGSNHPTTGGNIHWVGNEHQCKTGCDWSSNPNLQLHFCTTCLPSPHNRHCSPRPSLNVLHCVHAVALHTTDAPTICQGCCDPSAVQLYCGLWAQLI
jgi:hypothetical protein